MKKIILSFAVLSMLAFTGCSTPEGIDSDLSSLNSVSAANFDRIFDISTDNSGLVRVTPIGEGISKSVVTLGHGNDGEITLFPGESTSHNYPEGSYNVTIVSYDLAGQTTTNTYPLQVTYVAPTDINVEQNFSGTSLTITATANYANGMQVTWGDGGANEVPTVMTGSLGQTFTVPAHNYAPGDARGCQKV